MKDIEQLFSEQKTKNCVTDLISGTSKVLDGISDKQAPPAQPVKHTEAVLGKQQVLIFTNKHTVSCISE